jgi:hypothetical protein
MTMTSSLSKPLKMRRNPWSLRNSRSISLRRAVHEQAASPCQAR